MNDRQGVEIDYCPQCRGVWLDRGELDKIIERSAIVPEQQPTHVAPQGYREPGYPPQGQEHGYKQQHDHSKHHKKKSLLSEIFDF
jgi:hypothetical protein